MSNDSKSLDRVLKSLENKSSTSEDKQPWQEFLKRRSTVLAQESVQAVKPKGGSWFVPADVSNIKHVEVSDSNRGVLYPGSSTLANRQQDSRENLLGKPSFPELDFVPYNYRTNVKISSLVGSPISFSVVGPTVKHPDCDWQWEVTDNSSSPGVGDTLQMVPGPGGAQSAASILDAYNVSDPADVNGGLYVYISVFGDELFAPLNITNGATQTYLKATDLGAPTPETLFSNRWELYRVTDITGDTITLDPNKRLVDKLSFPAGFTTYYIRALVLMRPYASRLVAVPGSGVRGREKVFAMVAPAKAAASENYPPFVTWGGTAESWGGEVNLPIPNPSQFTNGISNASGRLVKVYPGTPDTPEDEGEFKIVNVTQFVSGGWTPDAADIGKVIKVTQADLSADNTGVVSGALGRIDIQIDSVTSGVEGNGTVDDLLGWYEVVEILQSDPAFSNTPTIRVKRVVVQDPVTGRMLYGPGPYSQANDSTGEADVSFYVYEPIEQLWRSPVLNPDDLNAARLVNLLDPADMERGGRGYLDTTTLEIAQQTTSYRPGAAVFDTRTGADPGNLLDLGFQMVLFPGKVDGTAIVPDFEKPIFSREAVIDPSVAEAQYITVDYSEGLVHLSHAPPAASDAASQVYPNSLVSATDNPRGEMVLFACCIPYSQEPSQVGAGPKIQGGLLGITNAGILNAADIRPPLSTPLEYRAAPNQTITAYGTPLRLEGLIYDLPVTGFIHLYQGTAEEFDYSQTFDEAVWYSGVTYDTVNSETLLGKASPTEGFNIPGGGTADITVGSDGALCLIEREVGAFLTPDPLRSVTYGTNFRAASLTFQYADLTVNGDGSVNILPTAAAGPAEELRANFPLGSASDVGRVYYDTTKQSWTVEAAPASGGTGEVGLEVSRGRIFASMSADFDAGVFTFRRFMNVASLIQPEALDLANSGQTSQRFRIRFDLNEGGDYDPGASNFFFLPEGGGASGSLCAMVEGATYLSAETSQLNGGSGTFNANQRIVIDLKPFRHRYDQTGSFHNLLGRLDEGPANPVNWVAVTMTAGTDIFDAEADLNSAFNALLGIEPVFYDTSGNRLSFTGRQVRILPSKPWLQSAEVSGGSPLTLDGGVRLLMTAYSADPRYPDRWGTVDLPALIAAGKSLGVNEVYTDPDVLAADLNTMFTAASPGAFFDFMGFSKGVAGERAFEWIGPGDARHPDASDTVVLLLGGRGDAVTGESSFFNVMVEIGQTAEYGVAPPAGKDLGYALGGDFTATGAGNLARCGLFFGDDAYDTATAPIQPTSYLLANRQTVKAEGNTALGFPEEGTEPLGRYVGSFRIDSVTDVGGGIWDMLVEEEYGAPHTGQGTPRALPLLAATLDTASYRARLALRSNIDTPGPHSRAQAYMGRQVWPERAQQAFGSTLASAQAGLGFIWVGYSTFPHDERGYGNQLMPLLNPNTEPSGYQNFLVYAHSESTETLAPNIGSYTFQSGDLVLGNEDPGGVRSGSEFAWEGIVLEKDVPALTSAPATNQTLLILVGPRGYSVQTDPYSARSHLQGSIHPDLFGPFRTSTVLPTTNHQVSFVSDPRGVSLVAAMRLLYPNLYGIESAGVQGTTTGSGPEDGAGLDGGSTTAGVQAKSNAVLMGGGHIKLVSALGPKALAGLSFSSASSAFLTEGQRFATTFVEHGVFTSTVALTPSSLFGDAALGSAGFMDDWVPSRLQDPTDPFGSDAYRASPLGQHQGAHAGGIAGLRFSGDAQIWLRNARPLFSNYQESGFFLLRQEPQDPDTADGVDLYGMGDATMGEIYHQPSGYGASTSTLGNLQEATFLLLLNTMDHIALASAFGRGPAAGSSDPNFPSVDFPSESEFSEFLGQNLKIHGAAQPVPFLTGCYLSVGPSPTFSAQTGNEGVWRVVGAPAVARATGYFDLLSATTNDRNYTPWVEPGSREDRGHRPTSVAAVMMVRLERFSSVSPDPALQDDIFSGELPAAANFAGHPWHFSVDAGAGSPIYVAEVMDPGGSPTGAPGGLSGLTLNPRATGSPYSTFPMDLVSVFAQTAETNESEGDLQGRGRLFGIFESQDPRGKNVSRAFFTTDTGGLFEADEGYLRATIYSSQREDRIDEWSGANTQGEFAMDAAGRVQYVGHATRLGLGVVVDGGLGIVQSNAFRATPRPLTVDNIGSLMVYGQDAGFPLMRTAGGNAKSRKGMQLPSTFNESEFYGTAKIAAPLGSIVFEDPFAAEGLGANLRRNQFSLDGTRDAWTAFWHHANFGGTALLKGFPNDSLFPFESAGLKFRAPGGVIYERPFSPLNAQGTSTVHSSFTGRHSSSGIKGLEIPTFGECLLLPKGPSAYGAGSSLDLQTEPALARPLYEFYNGIGLNTYGGPFGLTPTQALTEGVTPVDDSAGFTNFSPHFGNPGSVYAGYRHTHSREDGEWFGYNNYASPEFDMVDQIRVLEGMVVEDIDNGTFYTVGSIGRWREYPTANSHSGPGFGQLGDGTRPATLGGISAVGATPTLLYVEVADHTLLSANYVVAPGGPYTNGPTITLAGVDFYAVSGAPTTTQEFFSNHAAGDTDADRAVTAQSLADQITAHFLASPHAEYGEFFGTSLRISGNSTHFFEVLQKPFGFNRIILDNATGTDISAFPLVGYFDSGFLLGPTPAAPGNPSTIYNATVGNEPEIIYDLGPLHDPTVDPQGVGGGVNGYGDRLDVPTIHRRPLKGHKFRVTPNVEFVPVLGRRDTDGSLYPVPAAFRQTYPLADAFFTSFHYDFQRPASGYTAGDIGRFLYICGTDEYRYTGWWIILDVVPWSSGQGNPDGTQTVAVVRKWKRGQKDIAEDYLTIGAQRGGLPLLSYRPPILRMSADFETNDAVYDTGLFNSQSDSTLHSNIVMEVVRTDGASYATDVAQGDLIGAGVVDCVTLAAFANGDSRLNGTDVGGSPGAFIVWTAVTSPNHPRGVTVEVTYDLAVMTDPDDRELFMGVDSTLRIFFASNTGTSHYTGFGHGDTGEAPRSVGFHTYRGHSSQIDRGAGDRNNFSLMSVAGSIKPNVGGDYEAHSAAVGLRWVFSSPLLEEHVGSYLHLVRDQVYYFTVEDQFTNPSNYLESQQESGDPIPPLNFWVSGYPREGDSDAYRRMDVFRVGRCPTTNHIVVGGDCEVFEVGKDDYKQTIKYSPLGVAGVWPTTSTAVTPGSWPNSPGLNTNHLNSPVLYALQPVARERVVTISPRNMCSNVMLGRGLQTGPQGVSGLVAQGLATTLGADYTQSASINLENPFKLIDFRYASRLRINQHMIDHGVSTPTGDFDWSDGVVGIYDPGTGGNPPWDPFGDAPFLNNATNLAPELHAADAAASGYTWAPAAEWWQLYWPEAYAMTGQYDASSPRPSLKVDLTEAFTQAMGPGGGPNTPFARHAPRGVRLMKILVNFGVWGNVKRIGVTRAETPGYIAENEDVNRGLDDFFATFNLIVELPGSAGTISVNKATGTGSFPFGDRAPHARSTLSSSGFHTVPLYVNREAGDMMPNVMEVFATVGPDPQVDAYLGLNPVAGAALQSDWAVGHYEWGMGTLPGASTANGPLYSSATNPVIWGGIDFGTSAVSATRLRGLKDYSPFARSSRVAGGTNSPLVADGLLHKDPNSPQAAPAQRTGLTVYHTGLAPEPPRGFTGGLSDQVELPGFGISPSTYDEAVVTCSHAFTLGLTPVFNPENGGSKTRQPWGLLPWDRKDLPRLGNVFNIGNWLKDILVDGKYNFRSDSMLPPGARVYLEVTFGPGPGAKPRYGPLAERTVTADQDGQIITNPVNSRQTATGSWVGSVKCIFEVETADGTAYTQDVNVLGHIGE